MSFFPGTGGRLKPGIAAGLLIALLAPRAQAALDSRGAAASEAPQTTEAGDVPTAYGYARHELRPDVRFYGGGGVLAKAHFGIYKWLSLGGGVSVPGLIGTGPLSLSRDHAQFSVKVVPMPESEKFPALALGWDGPAYAGGELRGLYAALSKEIKSPLGYFQVHAGANSAVLDGFQAGRDLRGFAAISTTFRQLTLFSEADELGNPLGPGWNAGGRFFFDPISLGVEFRDLAGLRQGWLVSRLLRVSYTGLF